MNRPTRPNKQAKKGKNSQAFTVEATNNSKSYQHNGNQDDYDSPAEKC